MRREYRAWRSGEAHARRQAPNPNPDRQVAGEAHARRQVGRRREPAGLPAQQGGVDAARARELGVRALLRDLPAVHDDNAVRRAHRGQPARPRSRGWLAGGGLAQSAAEPARHAGSGGGEDRGGNAHNGLARAD